MGTGAADSSRPAWTVVLRAALVLAGVTSAVFAPELFRDPSDTEAAPVLTIVWVVALAVAAPVAAFLLCRRQALATDLPRALVLAAPQLPLVLLLVGVDVWLDVRSGYLLAGSGEEAMSYGIGTTVGAALGALVVVLVALAARGGDRSRPVVLAPGRS